MGWDVLGTGKLRWVTLPEVVSYCGTGGSIKGIVKLG